MFTVFFRAMILYIVIIASMRLMGKRQLGDLQPSELVVTLMLSNIATLPVENIDIPMTMGVIPIFTIVGIDVIISHISLRSRLLRRVMSGSSKIIISHGKLDQKMLKDLRFTVDDIMQSLRSQQIFDISQVQLAVVETTGTISVYQKKEYQEVTCGDMGIQEREGDPPQLIVDGGKVIEGSLKSLGFNRQWLDRVLKEKGHRVRDIFMMTADGGGETVIIPFEKGGRK